MKINPPSSSSRGLTSRALRVTCPWESVWFCWPHFLFWECCTGIRNFTTRNPAKSWVSIHLLCSVPTHQVFKKSHGTTLKCMQSHSAFLPFWFKLFCSDMCNEKIIYNRIVLDLKEWAIISKNHRVVEGTLDLPLLTVVLPILVCEWVSYKVLCYLHQISYPLQSSLHLAFEPQWQG